MLSRKTIRQGALTTSAKILALATAADRREILRLEAELDAARKIIAEQAAALNIAQRTHY